jgi:hypothetical protein
VDYRFANLLPLYVRQELDEERDRKALKENRKATPAAQVENANLADGGGYDGRNYVYDNSPLGLFLSNHYGK